MPEVKKKTTKARKKLWFGVVAPKLFNEAPLGEALAYEQEDLIGKILKINFMNLSNDIKKQNINIKFKIDSFKGDKAITNIVGYEMIPTSVKRIVGKSRKRLDISFSCKTQDNINVRIKPLLLIRIITKGSTALRLRRETTNFIKSNVRKMSYETLVNDIVSHKLQSTLKEALKKIYPLRICEIRELSIEKEKRQETKETEETIASNEKPEKEKEEKVKTEKQEEEKEKPKTTDEAVKEEKTPADRQQKDTPKESIKEEPASVQA